MAVLPAALGELDALTTLDVAGNALAALPLELVQLRRLRTLDLSGNAISALPPGLLASTDLITLTLAGNPYTDAQLADDPGYARLQDRRRQVVDKMLQGGAEVSLR